jgi:glycosyltransferase involved in cell wall biosynthesis
MAETISVIVPNLNMGGYLDHALASIAQQNPRVHEVVLVDCGSTDQTFAVIDKHRAAGLTIRVLEHPGLHPGAARNRGLAGAQGELIAFLDADDLWPADKLQRQTARLVAAPRVDMVTGYVRYFEVATGDGLSPEPGSRTQALFHVNLGACLYRREVFDQIGGGFDESLVYSEDVDLLLRVREHNIPFTILRCVSLYYRQHPASMMSQPDPRKEMGFKLAAHKSLLRRRAAGTLGQPLRDFFTYLEPES